MILTIKFPRLRNSEAWVANAFSKHYPKLKTKRLVKFLTLEYAKSLTGLPRSYFFTRLKTHRKAHAILWNGELLIHPDSFILLYASHWKSKVKRHLKESSLSE